VRVVLHSVDTTFFETARNKKRLILFVIILDKHGSGSYTTTPTEAVLRIGIKLKRVVAGFLALLFVFSSQ